MTGILLGLGAALGLAVGSFLNVVVWRVPRGESVVRPPSACPHCGHTIRARDNVPVLSWLLLGRRCRDCRAPIAVRYPLVELITAVAFVVVVVRFGGSAAVPAYWYLAAIGIALSAIDLDVRRLPDAIVLPSYPVLGVLLVVASAADGDWDALVRAGIGAAALFALYFLMVVVHPGAMGFGDVKLAGLLGGALAWLGWGAFAVGAFAAFLFGGLYAVVLLLTGRAGRKTGVPFGPWMILGTAVGIAVGEPLWAAYLDLVGL